MWHSILYIISALNLLNNVSGAYFTTTQSLDSGESPIRVYRRLPRHLPSRSLFARSPLPLEKEKTTNKDTTTLNSAVLTPNVAQVNFKSTSNDNVVQEAAKALALATKNVDNIIMVIQNPKSTDATIKKAAQEALKDEAEQDFPRQALASAALNVTEAQGALGIIRDQAPVVIGGFKEIERNSANRKKVIESLKDIVLARLQVVAANNALIAGIQGGDRRLTTTSQVSPSQEAIGNRQLDVKQKQTVEEAIKNLATQTKKVDEAVAIILTSRSSSQEIETAAKEALTLEAEEDFARQVLASAARDPKAAMETLAVFRDHEPSEVIAGFKAIAANPQDAASVKRNIDLIVKARQIIVPANLKLIELADGSSTLSSKELLPGKSTRGTSLVTSTSSTGGNTNGNNANTGTTGTGTTSIGTNIIRTSTDTNLFNSTLTTLEFPDPKKNVTSAGPKNLLKDSSSQTNAAESNSRDPRGLLVSLAGDDLKETSVVLFGSATKAKTT